MKQKSPLRTIIQNNSVNSPETGGYFSGIFALYFYKKMRRIADAIYLLTNHIKDSEPIKSTIRAEAIKMLNLSIKNKDDSFTEVSNVLYEEAIKTITSIISLLEVIVVAGMINEANFYLLNRELNAIFANITDKLKGHISPKEALPMSFMNVEIGNEGRKKEKDKSIKDKNIILSNVNPIKSQIFRKNTLSSDSDTSEGGRKNLLRTVNKLDKEKKIIEALKDNRKVTIKDITVLMPEYGEKTIQREILRLVSAGVLSKSGEKRWTLYFLSPNYKVI